MSTSTISQKEFELLFEVFSRAFQEGDHPEGVSLSILLNQLDEIKSTSTREFLKTFTRLFRTGCPLISGIPFVSKQI